MEAVNQEQLALYYGIGRFISANTRNKNWGKGFIEAVSEQLRKELPGLRGFSAPSMRKMRTFYEEWQTLENHDSAVTTAEIASDKNLFVPTNKLTESNQNSFVPTNKLAPVEFKINANFPIAAFMSISFSHHYAIVSKVKDLEQRKFYIQFAADTKVKVEDLEQLIDDDLFHHQGQIPNNFKIMWMLSLRRIFQPLTTFRKIRNKCAVCCAHTHDIKEHRLH